MAWVLSLCDFTGNMVKPWCEAGWDATIVDVKHSVREKGTAFAGGGSMMRLGMDVRKLDPDSLFKTWPTIVFAFPPCTSLAVSGARWFKEKGLRNLAEAIDVFGACVEICEKIGVPYMIENPVSTISSYYRKPNYTFDPCDYGDPYTKRTCLWTGNGFIMPPKKRVAPTKGSKMHLLPPSERRAEIRSETPMGFARAVFLANHKE